MAAEWRTFKWLIWCKMAQWIALEAKREGLGSVTRTPKEEGGN